MQSLKETLAKGPVVTKLGKSCSTCAWRENLNTEDRQAFESAVESGAWPIRSLYRIAKDFGVTVSESGFSNCVKKHKTSIK